MLNTLIASDLYAVSPACLPVLHTVFNLFVHYFKFWQPPSRVNEEFLYLGICVT